MGENVGRKEIHSDGRGKYDCTGHIGTWTRHMKPESVRDVRGKKAKDNRHETELEGNVLMRSYCGTVHNKRRFLSAALLIPAPAAAAAWRVASVLNRLLHFPRSQM